jgi:hypothetical protein
MPLNQIHRLAIAVIATRRARLIRLIGATTVIRPIEATTVIRPIGATTVIRSKLTT